MTDRPGKNGANNTHQTASKDEEEKPFTTRIKEGVGRHLETLSQFRTSGKAKLLKSLSQHEAKREDAENELSSRPIDTESAYSLTALPSSDRDYHQTPRPPPYQFEHPHFVISSSAMSSGLSRAEHLKGKASQNFQLKPEFLRYEDQMLSGSHSTDIPSRVGMANRKQSSYSPNTLPIPQPCSYSPGSHSGADNASERAPRALAAGVLVSPCLEAKELIFSNKSHLHHSDLSLPTEGSSDDTLRLAVPLFTKDVHNAFKNVLRPDRQEVTKPPPEVILPKSTIIVNRFEAGSPYFDISKYTQTHARDKKAVDISRHSQENGSPAVSTSPQRTAPVSFLDATQASQLYAMPIYLATPLGSYTSTPFQPPSLSAPPLVAPQPGYYWAPQPSAPPMAPTRSQREQYIRVEEEFGNLRQRPPASSFREKLGSCFPLLFGFVSSGRREESVNRLPSYSQHQASLNNIFRNGAHGSSFTDTQRRRRSKECDPDDLLLQMACCCCWPVGLAAKIITALFPRERDSCVGYLARQMSLCALLLGTAVYLVIMIVFISLMAALSTGHGHY